MKHRNNNMTMKQNDILYRRIMKSISEKLGPIIEDAINEEDSVTSEAQKAAEAIWNSCSKDKAQLKGAIAMMKTVSGGNGNFKYKGVLYKDLLPVLQKYLDDDNKGSVNERTRRLRRR